MALARWLWIWGPFLTASPVIAGTPFTVTQNLPPKELAAHLIGERLAAKVIEAVWHNDEYVEFYTQPVITRPELNGICRTDVITIDFDQDETNTGLSIAHIEARPRYKSLPGPEFEKYNKAQAAACASLTTAVDAFRAPSAGDAQWLAKIQRQYSDPKAQFRFSCLPDTTCAEARRILPRLALNLATQVQSVDCPPEKTGDVYENCYRLVFPRAGHGISDRSDLHDFEDRPEWILTVFAGISDGSAPVKLHSVELVHLPQLLLPLHH